MQTVLIVEDSRTQQEILRTLVERFGFSVHTASSAEEALEKCAVVRFAAILMDIGIPSFDGFECCKRLRVRERHQQAPRVPVIAVTARSIDDTFKNTCQQAGIDDYMPKPFEPEVLRKVLLRHTYSPAVPNLKLLPGYLSANKSSFHGG